MPEFRHKLALIIPTRNRLPLLLKLFRSLESQKEYVAQLIIVDGSVSPLEVALRESRTFDFDYVHVFPPSLTRQRNAGLCIVRPEITIVGFMDDDVEFKPDAILKMLGFWDSAAKEVGGASFNIVNNPPFHFHWMNRFFGMHSKKQGLVLRSGYNTPVFPGPAVVESEWLCGGATIWRKEIVDQHKYDEWFAGTAYFEDMDFSYSVRRTHKLYIVGNAAIDHNPPPFVVSKYRFLEEMRVTYRYYFVKKHFGRSALPAFYWSTVGQILSHAFAAVLFRRASSVYSLLGSIVGLSKVLTGKVGGINQDFRQSISTSRGTQQ